MCQCFPHRASPAMTAQPPTERICGSFRDITLRWQAEQRLTDYSVVLEFQKAQMEQANREMERANAELARANAKLARANAELEALATRDALTGLFNHRVLGERLSEEVRRAQRYGEPLSLILLDVDQFKEYNDTFGHLAGNAVLRQLAHILHDNVRETDLAARFGGEEFALILPHTACAEALEMAERIRAGIENSVWQDRPVTASFGVCALTDGMADAAALVTCADKALYHAKASGRNQVADGNSTP